MKILSVAIPCYNSAAYMRKAVDSAMAAGKDVEVIIVDDGSSDNTAAIADEYEFMYPEIVRVIHKENGGHGDAVMTGLRYSSGFYFKVLDSDDWFDTEALAKMMKLLRGMVYNHSLVDMVISNYVYEKQGEKHKKCINYRSAMPRNSVFTWADIHHFSYSQNILMHSVIYRTELLRRCGMQLPKHTFYVDNIYVYLPLPHVKTLYYCDVNLYRYFIGREDQSVNEKVMIDRVDQQIFVTKHMIDNTDMSADISSKLRKYMVKYIVMMMTVSTVLLLRSGKTENLIKRNELWNYLEEKNPDLYRAVNRSFLGWCMQFESRFGKKIILTGYSASRKVYGFN